MAATLVATFTLIRCVRGSLYGDTWNLVQSVRVGETLNCEYEVKNPQDLYVVGLRKYGTTVGHIWYSSDVTLHSLASNLLAFSSNLLAATHARLLDDLEEWFLTRLCMLAFGIMS